MQPKTTDLKSSAQSRVLVVESERSEREKLQRWLGAAGYDCETAATAHEAVVTLDPSWVGVVICNIRIEGCAGPDFVTELQRHAGNPAVIVLADVEDRSLAGTAIKNGASGYLLKPAQEHELLFEVSRALERRRLITAAEDYSTNLERRVSEQNRLVRMAHEEMIYRLVVASMVRDDETGSHIKRIGLFGAAVADAVGWSQEEVDNMRLAAPMHDIGKIGIPDAILLKPGKLTPEEIEIMKTHTLIGASILKNSYSPMMQLAELIARSHHEWWNGTGYPDRLRGEEIPTCARIVAIVDVYDALTHDRVYRKALPESEALAILEQGRGTHFDPNMLDAFFRALPVIRELAARESDPDMEHEGFGTAEALLTFKQTPVSSRAKSTAGASTEEHDIAWPVAAWPAPAWSSAPAESVSGTVSGPAWSNAPSATTAAFG